MPYLLLSITGSTTCRHGRRSSTVPCVLHWHANNSLKQPPQSAQSQLTLLLAHKIIYCNAYRDYRRVLWHRALRKQLPCTPGSLRVRLYQEGYLRLMTGGETQLQGSNNAIDKVSIPPVLQSSSLTKQSSPLVTTRTATSVSHLLTFQASARCPTVVAGGT